MQTGRDQSASPRDRVSDGSALWDAMGAADSPVIEIVFNTDPYIVSLITYDITCGGTPAVNPQLHTCSSVYTLLCVHFVCLLYSQSMRIDTIPDTHISQRMHGGTSYRTDNVRCANNNEISFHDATQNTERHRT